MVFSSLNAQHISTLNPFPQTIRIDDKGSVDLVCKGDHSLSWLETTDGYPVFQVGDHFEYAVMRKDVWASSGIRLQSGSFQEKAFLKTRPVNFIPDLSHLKSAMAISTVGGVPAIGDVRLPVICIEFSDMKHQRTKEDMADMFNKDGYKGNISFREYFASASHDKLKLSFDVFGWYDMGASYKEYSDEKGMALSGYVVQRAIREAANNGADFSKYDNDKDGDVDAVVVIYAGLGAEEIGDKQYIWAHSWSLQETIQSSLNFNGVKLNDYTIGCEMRRNGDAGIGMKCHELGHALGLPDLYDGTGKSSGLGHWCMMSAGPWLNEVRPANFSAWCRVKLGWDLPKVVSQNSFGSYQLAASAVAENEIFRINTTRNDEYYLVENRQKNGNDTKLPGSGMALYHINGSKLDSGSGNNDDRDNPAIRLTEADFSKSMGLYNGKDRGSAGDLFPGSTGKTTVGPATIPNTNFFNGSYCGLQISNIRNENGSLFFDLRKAQPFLEWNGLVFMEGARNDGSIGNSLSATLHGGSFAIKQGLLPANNYTLSGLPEGLSAEVTLSDSVHAIVSLKGKATAHAASDSNPTVFFRFENPAFQDVKADEIKNSIMSAIHVNFNDQLPPGVVWRENFEAYDANKQPLSWELWVENASTFEMLAVGDKQISCDAGNFTCKPYEGKQSLSTSENWQGNAPAGIRLISPELDFTSIQKPVLKFAEIRGWDASWPVAKPVHQIKIQFQEKGKSNWESLTSIDALKSDFTKWILHENIDLNALEGKQGKLAFCSSTHTYYWQIDDIEITDLSTVTTTEAELNLCTVFPVPSDRWVTVSSADPILSWKLYSSTGQLMQNGLPRNQRIQLDLASFLPGMYLIQVETIKDIETFRLIKINYE